ncbi:hypothetical protein EVAR_76059_1 [Eumeta japonica]|uniref:Uncharacterized protein n=1 Tax=Eumeta variegata TaxID=151549 RepID=A0A4C1W6G6_EUMVA|nr:hypothetical protein EVAR_76059_1 [Eumeta japonica]
MQYAAGRPHINPALSRFFLMQFTNDKALLGDYIQAVTSNVACGVGTRCIAGDICSALQEAICPLSARLIVATVASYWSLPRDAGRGVQKYASHPGKRVTDMLSGGGGSTVESVALVLEVTGFRPDHESPASASNRQPPRSYRRSSAAHLSIKLLCLMKTWHNQLQ